MADESDKIADESELLKSDQSPDKKDGILEVINLFSGHFLRENPENWQINQLLALLGSAIDCNRVFVFQIYRNSSGDISAKKKYEWVGAGFSSDTDTGDQTNFSFSTAGLLRWNREFEYGNIIVGDTDSFPERERPYLISQKIKSILNIPLIITKSLWGFMRFDICHDAKEWLRSDVEALKTASVILSSAIEHENVLQKLKYTNRILENILEHTLLKIAYLDRNFNFVKVNKLYAQADERPPDYFVGKNHFVLYPNEENQKIFQSVLETGLPHIEIAKAFEYRDHPERGVSYWDWSLIPVKDNTGAVDALILSLQDVSDRVEAQFEIIKSNELYKRLVHGLPDIVYIFSSTRGALFWSPRVNEILGIDPEKLKVNPYLWHDAIHPDDIQHVDEVIKKAGKGEPFSIEYRIKDMAGDWHWLLDRSISVRIENGETIIEGLASDVTERKKAADELLYQKEFENTILRAERSIVTVNDGEFLIYANPAFYNFFDEYGTLEEFRQKHKCICELFEKTEQEGYLYDGKDGKSWLDYIKDNPRDFYRVLIIHHGKEYRFILTVERMEIRNMTRNISNLMDVTELEEYRSYLEQKVSREVERRLQSEKMIVHQAKLAAMGDLTSRIAHHWRQPLSAFSVAIENLRESIDSGEINKHNYGKTFEDILAQVRAMSDLISMFNVYFKSDAEAREFSVKENIDETASFFLNSEIGGTYNLIVNIRSDKKVFGIPRDFGYALLSILNNSKDALESRKVLEPRIEITVDNTDYGRIKIVIQDNGGGINVDIIDKIFEPYYTTKFPSVGTGMGLYVARNIIEEQLGGKISVENAGKGAKFTILL